MTLLVKPPIDIPRIGIINPRRDTEIRVVVGDKLSKLPLTVGSVSENGRPLEVNLADQFFSDSDIVDIAGGQHDLNRIAQGVYNGVNLGASAAAAHSDALIGLCLVLTGSRISGGGFYGISGF